MTDRIDTPAALQQRYTAVAIGLHWVIALMIVSLIGVGWYMGTMPPGADRFAVMQLHKSFGITVLTLSVARLAWRLMNRPPPEPPMPGWQALLSRTVHVLFYVLIIAMPLTGWIMASASSDAPTKYFGLFDARLPGIPALPLETRDGLEEGFEQVHSNLAWVIVGLLALHVAGALKHQFMDRDGLLARMAPGLFGRTAGPPDNGQGLLWAVGAAALVFATAFVPSLMMERPAVSEEQQQVASNAPAWVVDPGRSSIVFRFNHMGTAYEGRFPGWTAQINFDPDAPPDLETPVDGQVRVVIPTGRITTGEPYFDENVVQGDWFDVSKYPQAVFEVPPDGLYRLSETRYEATGVLRIKGVDHPVRLPFTLSFSGDVATMHGEVDLLRLNLGIGAGTRKDPDPGNADEEWVEDKVTVVVDVVARRQ
jgi:cytochrome b561